MIKTIDVERKEISVEMEIILGKTAGFCYGVKNAVLNAEEKVKKYKQIDCLGELVHNGEVIKKLEKMGLRVIDNINESKKRVIIRAHGVSKDIYKIAKENHIKIYDFTCPKVLNIHKIAEKHAKNGYFIFLFGGKKHPESIGTISFCGENCALIENENEIIEAINKLHTSKIKKLLIIVQTTFNLQKFEQYIEQIKFLISKDIKIDIKNTICNATRLRQEETEEISKNVDCMIIIGGKNSSNTKKLYDISKEKCKNTFIIETKDELENSNIREFEKIGIMAGASTPKESIDELINFLKKERNAILNES